MADSWGILTAMIPAPQLSLHTPVGDITLSEDDGAIVSVDWGWAAVQTVKTRSMESATGLLYINVALIAAGTIDAAGLYFGAGLLV